MLPSTVKQPSYRLNEEQKYARRALIPAVDSKITLRNVRGMLILLLLTLCILVFSILAPHPLEATMER